LLKSINRTSLKQHNSGKVTSTKAFIPWLVCLVERFETFKNARERELYFKTGSGRRYLQTIKENFIREVATKPDISDELPGFRFFCLNY